MSLCSRISRLALTYANHGCHCRQQRLSNLPSSLPPMAFLQKRKVIPQSKEAKISQVKQVQQVQDLMRYAYMKVENMTPDEVVATTERLYFLHEHGKAQLTKEDVLKSNEFLTLCSAIEKTMRAFNVDDLIKTTMALNYFGVPSNSKLMQYLLKLISANVNLLSTDSAQDLQEFLDNAETTPIGTALHDALSILVKRDLFLKTDWNRLGKALGTLRLCVVYDWETEIKMVAEKIAASEEIFCTQILPKEAKTVFHIINMSKFMSEELFLLAKQTMNIIQMNLKKLTLDELSAINLKANFVMNTLFKADRSLCVDYVNACTKHYIVQEASFENTILLLKMAAKIEIYPKDLLDYLVNEILKYPKTLIGSDFLSISYFIACLSKADYQTNKDWFAIRPLLADNILFFQQFFQHDFWSRTTFHLTSLGIFKNEALEKLLNAERVKLLEEGDLSQAITVQSYIQVFYPEYKGCRIGEDKIMEKIFTLEQTILECQDVKVVIMNMLNSLEYYSEDPRVDDNVYYSKSGILISYAALLHEGHISPLDELASAADFGDGYVAIEDVVRPEKSQLVLFLPGGSGRFKQIASITTLMHAKVLRAKGHAVVIVPSQMFLDKTMKKKIKVLIHLIREQVKFETLFAKL